MRASLAAVAFLALCAGCGSERATLDRLWHRSGQTVVLIPGTSDYATGDVRVSFLVVDDRGRTVDRPAADVWVSRSRHDVPFERRIARLETVDAAGAADSGNVDRIYVAHLRIVKPGRYWVLARPVGPLPRIGGIRDLDVKRVTSSPAIGSRALPSRTPTIATAPVHDLTTRVPPDRALLRYSVADSLRAHVPFVLVFATPRFCTSRTCGPVVDVVDSVRRAFVHSGVRFIHIEIYAHNDPANGTNRWVRQWHLPSEPWIFLVGRDGRIKSKFEGATSRAELVAAVRRDLLGRATASE